MAIEYFGNKLRILRTDRHLTQDQLAKKLGLVRATISAYESASLYPSVEVLIKLCEIFDVSSDYLLGLSDKTDFELSALTDEDALLIRQLITKLSR